MRVYNKPVFQTLPLIMNANLTSQAMQLIEVWSYSIQVVWTGTPTGVFKLQGSADNIIVGTPSLIATQSPVHWSDIADSSETISASGDFMWNVSQVGYNYVRLVYTDGSSGASTATITSANFNGKAF